MKIEIDGYEYNLSPRSYYESLNNGSEMKIELHCIEDEFKQIKKLFESRTIFKFDNLYYCVDAYIYMWLTPNTIELNISMKKVHKYNYKKEN